jgi:hypothetical protein
MRGPSFSILTKATGRLSTAMDTSALWLHSMCRCVSAARSNCTPSTHFGPPMIAMIVRTAVAGLLPVPRPTFFAHVQTRGSSARTRGLVQYVV